MQKVKTTKVESVLDDIIERIGRKLDPEARRRIEKSKRRLLHELQNQKRSRKKQLHAATSALLGELINSSSQSEVG